MCIKITLDNTNQYLECKIQDLISQSIQRKNHNLLLIVVNSNNIRWLLIKDKARLHPVNCNQYNLMKQYKISLVQQCKTNLKLSKIQLIQSQLISPLFKKSVVRIRRNKKFSKTITHLSLINRIKICLKVIFIIIPKTRLDIIEMTQRPVQIETYTKRKIN